MRVSKLTIGTIDAVAIFSIAFVASQRSFSPTTSPVFSVTQLTAAVSTRRAKTPERYCATASRGAGESEAWVPQRSFESADDLGDPKIASRAFVA